MESEKQIFTIEEKLKSYTMENRPSAERYEVLWHAWKHNKRWLSQLLEWVMPSFPNYSRHGESHANAILHSIEMILGREQINNLSASDCFLILHVVYIHDIGMCITHLDREKLMQKKEFIEFLNNKKNDSDGRVRKYATLLLTYCEEMPKVSSQFKLLEVKLEIYYAILYMIAEYKRKEHGDVAAQRLKEWVDTPENLGVGFSTSGIPSRFFYTIAACAGVHTSYDFNDVMKLHKVDTGYAHDYMHPRFAAVLLQLGDALDLDNDRFHPLVKQFSGEMPHASEIHFGKHKSIRRLRVSPEKITIEADCEDAEVLRLVNDEYECIKDILKNATYNWSAICPENMSFCLPVLESIELMLEGKEIKGELVNVKFEIQQEKAFNILQGNNIYKNDTFVFLREIFQNAIDASKMQYWTDWKGSRWCIGDETEDKLDISKMGKMLSPHSYPIEVELYLAKKKEYDDNYEILQEEIEQELYEKSDSNGEYCYGVLVRVIDHGIGMTAKDIKSIANVGSSYEQRKDLVDKMPRWLKPTAEFGIGLQSVFLTAHTMTAYTHPRTNEKYKIQFQTTGDGGKGHIGVTPLEDSDYPKSFGTIFEVFVANDKKKKQQEDLELWRSRDPFEKDYDKKSNIRNAKELQLQLAMYLNSLVGEKIFPIELKMHDFDIIDQQKENIKEKDKVENNNDSTCEKKETDFQTKITKQLSNLNVGFVKHKVHFEFKDQKIVPRFEVNEPKSNDVTWAYRLNGIENMIIGEIGNDFQYAFDYKKFKLYLWNSKRNVYARFGAERLQAMRNIMKKSDMDEEDSYVKIYYKGVYAIPINWDADMGLMECLDIKDKLNREYLKINRGDFTESGYKYIYNELYMPVLEAAHEALKKCDEEKGFVEKIEEKMKLYIEQETDMVNLQSAILSLVCLSAYAQNINVGQFPAPSENKKCHNWIRVLQNIQKIVEEGKVNKAPWAESTFFTLDVFPLRINQSGQISVNTVTEETCVEIMMNIKRYAIVSRRNHRNATWEKYLVRFESMEKGESDSGIEEIKNDILMLKTEWNDEKRKLLIRNIEQWGRNLKQGLRDYLNATVFDISPSKVLNQNAIFSWLMKNVPSIAMFSDEKGSLRVNLLDFEYTDSMYFDINTKWSVYSRMVQNYEKTRMKRFSMIAPTGYCQLAFDENPGSVCYIKRGEFSRTGQRYMILPLTGDEFKKILSEFDALNLNLEDEALPAKIRFFIRFEKFVQKVVGLLDDKNEVEDIYGAELIQRIREKYEEENKHRTATAHVIEDMFLKELRNERGKNDNVDESERSVGDGDEAINKLADEHFITILEWTMGVKSIDKKLLDILNDLYQEVHFINVRISEDEKKRLKKLFLGYCGLDEKSVSCNGSDKEQQSKVQLTARETMMQLTAYVHENSWLRLPKPQIENLYKQFVCELVDDMEYQLKVNFEQIINRSYLLTSIKK